MSPGALARREAEAEAEGEGLALPALDPTPDPDLLDISAPEKKKGRKATEMGAAPKMSSADSDNHVMTLPSRGARGTHFPRPKDADKPIW